MGAALKIPAWSKPPVWIHSDLSPGNTPLKNGKLCAVIDFGMVGIGDPACDLIIAWNLLPASIRESFRQKLNVDDATWHRGRGWALSNALIALPYYKDTNPSSQTMHGHVIKEVIKSSNETIP
jgi:aminoglycoside phosphotransferase (APT) family kinase protein